MLRKCRCANIYQDAKYGKGVRIMNMMKHTLVGQYVRCTVCQTEQRIGD